MNFEEYHQLFKDLVAGVETASLSLDLYGLSEALIALGSLGASISDNLLAAQKDKETTTYRKYQRLDHDIMLEVRVIQSRLAVLRIEHQNMGSQL